MSAKVTLNHLPTDCDRTQWASILPPGEAHCAAHSNFRPTHKQPHHDRGILGPRVGDARRARSTIGLARRANSLDSPRLPARPRPAPARHPAAAAAPLSADGGMPGGTLL